MTNKSNNNGNISKFYQELKKTQDFLKQKNIKKLYQIYAFHKKRIIDENLITLEKMMDIFAELI